MTAPIVAIDFDGVIHAHTSEWTNAHHIHDGPVDGALPFIREAIDAGFHVVIHTTRARTATTVPEIYAWLQKHGLEEKYTWPIEVTALKPAATIYIDDHGWRFEGAWPSIETIRGLRPWYKREREALSADDKEALGLDEEKP